VDLTALGAAKKSTALAKGFNTRDIKLTSPRVAEAFGLPLAKLPL